VQTDLISITVNGKACNTPPEQSVIALLEWLQIPADRVAVELNKSIVRKRDWAQTKVQPNSQIEIVEFVGGG